MEYPCNIAFIEAVEGKVNPLYVLRGYVLTPSERRGAVDRISPQQMKTLRAIFTHRGRDIGTICELAGLKRSTFYNVKRYLLRRGWFRYVVVVNPRALGYHGLVVSYERFGAVQTLGWRSPRWEKIKDDRIVTLVHTRKDWFSMGFVTGISDYLDYIRCLSTLRLKSGLDHGDMVHVLFSLDDLRIVRYLDFSTVLQPVETPGLRGMKAPQWRPGKKDELIEVDQKTLYFISRYPQERIKTVAALSGIPRTTMCGSRKRLLRRNLFEEVAVPEMARLGLRYFSMIHVPLRMHLTLESRDAYRDFSQRPGVIFALISHTDEIYIVAHRDPGEAHEMVRTIVERYVPQEQLRLEPHIVTLPILDADFEMRINYSGLVRRRYNVKSPIGERVEAILREVFEEGGLLLLEEHLEAMGIELDDLSPENLPELTSRLSASLESLLPRKMAQDLIEEIENIPANLTRKRRKSRDSS